MLNRSNARPKRVRSQNKILRSQRSLPPDSDVKQPAHGPTRTLYDLPCPAYDYVPVQHSKGSVVVFVTAPDLKTARRLASATLKSRLVACANLLPKIESHYWWGGKIESSPETLIIFKTTRSKLKALEQLIVEKHPYDTPEFIALPIAAGNRRYLNWLSVSIHPQR